MNYEKNIEVNMAEKIKIGRELESEQRKLSESLNKINGYIENQKDNCSHIFVDLGRTHYRYRCLLCGKGRIENYVMEPKYIVYAEDYLTQYDIQDEEQCNEKFDNIQTLALGLLQDDPNMSREELCNRLNQLIQESIALRENDNTQKLVKN